jgi:very-short-patch-repair endonuclease
VTIVRVGPVIQGSQAIKCGELTRGQLRWRYRQLFPDVHIQRDTPASLYNRTVGAWLWSRERGVITGRAAAAMHGAQWVRDDAPIELIWKSYDTPDGIIARDDHFLYDDVVEKNGMAVATIPRCAYDLGRHLPRNEAVIHLDALARATGLRAEHVVPVIARYKGARHIRRLRTAIDLMDGGAQSPKESLLRLLLIDAGFRRPATQIPVHDEYGTPIAFLDMGWEDVKIAVEYDGDQHRSDRRQYVWDERRLRLIRERGYLHVKVIAEDRPFEVIERVRRAWAEREPGSMVV